MSTTSRPRHRLLSALLTALAAGLVLTGLGGGLAAGAPAGAPTGVTGIALDGAAQVAWQPVAGADAYVVLRGTGAGSIDQVVTPPGGTTATTFTDGGAANGTDYRYAVRATGDGVESASSAPTGVTPRAASCASAVAVVAENCMPGTSGWRATSPDQVSSGGIEGFTTASSIDAGDAVGVKVNTAAGAAYDVQIYRTGDYDGTFGRLIATLPGRTGTAQPACTNAPSTGLVDCSAWTTSLVITTTESWQSGIYLIRLARANGADYHVLLTVRDDDAPSDLLYLVPDTTYQAYNNYEGRSTYDWNSWGGATLSGTNRAVAVSFDRPYNQVRSGQRDWYTLSDLRMVSWLESQGYDVGYATASDLQRDPGLALGHEALISGGHDEYYSQGMRDALTAARDAGSSIFVSGANAMYWQVRFDAATRVMTVYKTVQSGPADPQGPTSTWRDPAGANTPENGLLGVMYIGDSDFTYFPLRVSAAEGRDPVWRHTPAADLAPGTTADIGSGIVGWEWDARVDNGAEPPGVVTVASSPVTGNLIQGNGSHSQPGSAVVNVTRYTAASGAIVFATGTNHWNRGLGREMTGDGEPNATIQQATVNVLSDMGATPATPSPGIDLDGSEAPRVVQTTPAAAATGASVTLSPTARFSRAMAPASLTTATVTLTPDGGSPVAATISYDAAHRRVTIDPVAALAWSTSYTARVTTGATAADGTPLGQASQWSFTTTAAPPPPTATASVPSQGATGVNPALPLSVTFSRAMDAATLTTGTVTLTGPGGAGVPAGVSYDAGTRRVTVTPAAALAADTAYTLTVSASAAAADGTALAAPLTRTFTTWLAAPAGPSVTATTPADGAGGVAVATVVTATFSRAMDADTLTAATVTLATAAGQAVPATVGYDAATRAVTLTPQAPLARSTTHTLTVAAGVRAADGIALGTAVTRSFTTSYTACPCSLFPDDLTPLAPAADVQDGRPGPGPFSYETGVRLTATSAGEIRAIRYYRSPGETGAHVGRVWSAAGAPLAQVTFAGETASGWQVQALATPVPVAAGREYVVSVNRNAFFPVTPGGLTTPAAAGPLTTVAGANGVYGAAAGTFPTASYADSNYFVDVVAADTPTAPSATGTTPAAGATDVPVDASPTATFSRTIASATITPATVALRVAGGGALVPATVSYDPATRRIVIDPVAALAHTTTYEATVSTGVTAGDGPALAAPVTWSFTTGIAPVAPPSVPGTPTTPTTGTTVPTASTRAAAAGLRAVWNRRTGRLTIRITGLRPGAVVRIAGRVVRPKGGVVTMVRRRAGALTVVVRPAAGVATLTPRTWKVTTRTRGAVRVVRIGR